jgi:hypothetical protein
LYGGLKAEIDIVLEYAAKGSLGDYFARGQQLSRDVIFGILHQITFALKYLSSYTTRSLSKSPLTLSLNLTPTLHRSHVNSTALAVGEQLEKRLSATALESLSISGESTLRLDDESILILLAAISIPILRHLDVSHNRIDAAGLAAARVFLRTAAPLQSIRRRRGSAHGVPSGRCGVTRSGRCGAARVCPGGVYVAPR